MAKFIKLTDRVDEMVVVNTQYIVAVEDLTDCGQATNTGVLYTTGSAQTLLLVKEPVADVWALLLADA